MKFLKIIIASTMLIACIQAAGSRPGAAEAYLMLARSDYFRNIFTRKLAVTNRATLKQRIKNAKLFAALKNALYPNAESSEAAQKTSNNRMKRFKNFHH